jgi:hypothetical protein
VIALDGAHVVLELTAAGDAREDFRAEVQLQPLPLLNCPLRVRATTTCARVFQLYCSLLFLGHWCRDGARGSHSAARRPYNPCDSYSEPGPGYIACSDETLSRIVIWEVGHFGRWDILSPAGRRVVESFFLVGFGCPAGRVFGLRWFDAQTPTQPQRVEVKLGSQGKEVQGPEAKETPVTPSNASCVILSFSSCGGDDDDDMNLCFEGT